MQKWQNKEKKYIFIIEFWKKKKEWATNYVPTAMNHKCVLLSEKVTLKRVYNACRKERGIKMTGRPVVARYRVGVGRPLNQWSMGDLGKRSAILYDAVIVDTWPVKNPYCLLALRVELNVSKFQQNRHHELEQSRRRQRVGEMKLTILQILKWPHWSSVEKMLTLRSITMEMNRDHAIKCIRKCMCGLCSTW
jgi:hypothetical protein